MKEASELVMLVKFKMQYDAVAQEPDPFEITEREGGRKKKKFTNISLNNRKSEYVLLHAIIMLLCNFILGNMSTPCSRLPQGVLE